ncbi:hypothetical protein HK101_002988 [Irineochytrium annulatum]|nr:hypothetical protein HK101_002988 [Irineochytrium annulatum]
MTTATTTNKRPRKDGKEDDEGRAAQRPRLQSRSQDDDDGSVQRRITPAGQSGLTTPKRAWSGGHVDAGTASPAPWIVQVRPLQPPTKYADDLAITQMRRFERERRPDPNYMDHQHEVTWQMREMLVSWLIDIFYEPTTRLERATLNLTVSVLDRFLSRHAITSERLQLVGAAGCGSEALQVAFKFDEGEYPNLVEAGFSLDPASLNEMEHLIVATLDFNIRYHSPIAFFHEYMAAAGTLVDTCDIDDSHELFHRLGDTLLIDHEFLAFPPSVIAGAIHFIARRVRQSLNGGVTDNDATLYCGYVKADIIQCVGCFGQYRN